MGDSKSSKKHVLLNKSTFEKKYWMWTVFVLSLIIFFSGGFGIIAFMINELSDIEITNSCGDGTSNNACSSVKPYFCSDERLIDLPTFCGCPEGFKLNFTSGNSVCYSQYSTGPKSISLKYTLNGIDNSIDYVVYEGFEEYISKIPRSINSSKGLNFSRADFKLKTINEEEQKKFILPLVIKIQNITDNKEDQARIAISIVQNIPFGTSNKTMFFWEEEMNYTRYPYDVLYDLEGVCGEKTDLLSLLLQEIGYGVSFFYYPEENHEALGIKCSTKESLMETGYCFVETTGPSIITDNQISYMGVGKLYSTPEFYILSEGDSLNEKIEEYQDAEKLIKIRNSIDKRGLIGPIQRNIIQRINEKYGLTEEYYR